MRAYKGFDASLTCKGYKFEEGKFYEHGGKVRLYETGFHACINPMTVLHYYPPNKSRFGVVEVSGETDANTDVIVCSEIKIERELNLHEFIIHAKNYLINRTTPNASKRSVIANGEDYSITSSYTFRSFAAGRGWFSIAESYGEYSAATETGDYSISVADGSYVTSTNTGRRSIATGYGWHSIAANVGEEAIATVYGSKSVAVVTNDEATAKSAGVYSVAVATSTKGTAISEDTASVALSTHSWGKASVGSRDAIAIATGFEGRAKAGVSGAIVLAYRNPRGDLIHIKAVKVGENGVKPDTWYGLNEHGEIVEEGVHS